MPRSRWLRSPAAPDARVDTYHDELNLVRWVASFAVVFSHSMETFAKRSSLLYGVVGSELHTSRMVFFFVSALTMTYSYRGGPSTGWLRFYKRRLRWVVLPYAVWTGIYFGMSYGELRGFNMIAHPTGTAWHQAGDYLDQLLRGVGDLYYLALLLQVILVWPLFVWALRRSTVVVHLFILVAAFGVEILLMLHAGQNAAANRRLPYYELYLIAGAVVGEHLEGVTAWLRRWWRLVGLAAVAVNVAAEVSFVLAVRGGTSPMTGLHTFEVRWIFLDLSVITLGYLAGSVWVSRRRPRGLAASVKAASDNTFGVYLSHGVLIDVMIVVGAGATLTHAGSPWWAVDLGVAAALWAVAAVVPTVLARTPLAFTVGRRRRPAVGTPASGRFEPIDRRTALHHPAPSTVAGLGA